MSRFLYHFTSSCTLPYILGSRELRPMPGNDGLPEFVHATSNPHGEPTAAHGTDDRFFRDGVLARVRFTLWAGDFEQWLTVVRRYPEWKPDLVRRLEAIGHRLGVSPYSWYARNDALALDKIVAVHTMVGSNRSWQPFDLATAEILQVDGCPDAKGVLIDNNWYVSERYVDTHGKGNEGYRFRMPIPEAVLSRGGFSDRIEVSTERKARTSA